MSNPKSLYQLPLPDEPVEKRRLGGQHDFIVKALGGLYPRDAKKNVDEALGDGPPRTILDFGTGNGAWAMAMAREFPHATVRGVDITLPRPPDLLPGNCSFEFGDFNKGSREYHDIDVIHSRFTRSGMANSHAVHDYMAGLLRPGGVLLVADCSMDLYTRSPIDGKLLVVPPAQRVDLHSSHIENRGDDQNYLPRRSWFALIMEEYSVTTSSPQGWPLPSLHDTLRSNNQRSTAYKFNSIEHRHYYVPVGWPGEEVDGLDDGEAIGSLCRDNMVQLLHTWATILVTKGHDKKIMDERVRRSLKEILDPNFRIYVSFEYSWGVTATR